MAWAQEHARQLNHDYIGTEHLLLGLLSESEGVAAHALAALDITLDAAREQLERLDGRGATPPQGHIPFTPQAKKTLELSVREAVAMGHRFIGSEHILLGLAGQGVGHKVLESLGAGPDAIRRQVMALTSELGPGTEHGGAWSRTASSSQDPPTGPLCSTCGALTAETAKMAVVSILGPDGEPRSVLTAYCGMCGAAYGLLPG